MLEITSAFVLLALAATPLVAAPKDAAEAGLTRKGGAGVGSGNAPQLDAGTDDGCGGSALSAGGGCGGTGGRNVARA